MTYSELQELTREELISDALTMKLIEENEIENVEDWQLVQWIFEEIQEQAYHNHCASFYSY